MKYKGERVQKDGGLRDRFDRKGFGINKYARANGLDRTILSRVLAGRLTGERKTQKGNVRKVIATLKRDGVWLGRLPWEDGS